MTDVAPTREWGVLLKASLAPDAVPATEEQLGRILAALAGDDKRATGGGRDFTIACWIEATDAASATRLAADSVRRAARELGLAPMTFVRSHAASVEGRFPAIPVTDAQVQAPDLWAVDIKVAMPDGALPATSDLLRSVEEAMADLDAVATFHGDLEKFLLDDGSGFTVRFWAEGDPIEEALDAARTTVLKMLDALGLPDARLVRLKAWSPAALRADTFPGASSREPRVTGELR